MPFGIAVSWIVAVPCAELSQDSPCIPFCITIRLAKGSCWRQLCFFGKLDDFGFLCKFPFQNASKIIIFGLWAESCFFVTVGGVCENWGSPCHAWNCRKTLLAFRSALEFGWQEVPVVDGPVFCNLDIARFLHKIRYKNAFRSFGLGRWFRDGCWNLPKLASLLHTYLHIMTYHLHRCSDMSTHFRPASAHIITPHLHTSSHIFCTHMCAHTHITTHLLDRSFSQIFTYLHASCHAFAHHLGPSAHLPVTSSSTDTAQRIFLANDAGHCCIGETGSTDANRVEHVTKGYPPDFVVSLVKCMWNAGFGGVWFRAPIWISSFLSKGW